MIFFRTFNRIINPKDFRTVFIRLPLSKNHLYRLAMLKDLLFYSCTLICDFAAFAVVYSMFPNLYFKSQVRSNCKSLIWNEPSEIKCYLPDSKTHDFVFFVIQFFLSFFSYFHLLEWIVFCVGYVLLKNIYVTSSMNSMVERLSIGQAYIIYRARLHMASDEYHKFLDHLLIYH